MFDNTNSELRVNLFKNELNSNGFGKFAAQHYYQISVQEHASGAEDLQGMFYVYRLQLILKPIANIIPQNS